MCQYQNCAVKKILRKPKRLASTEEFRFRLFFSLKRKVSAGCILGSWGGYRDWEFKEGSTMKRMKGKRDNDRRNRSSSEFRICADYKVTGLEVTSSFSHPRVMSEKHHILYRSWSWFSEDAKIVWSLLIQWMSWDSLDASAMLLEEKRPSKDIPLTCEIVGESGDGSWNHAGDTSSQSWLFSLVVMVF